MLLRKCSRRSRSVSKASGTSVPLTGAQELTRTAAVICDNNQKTLESFLKMHKRCSGSSVHWLPPSAHNTTHVPAPPSPEARARPVDSPKKANTHSVKAWALSCRAMSENASATWNGVCSGKWVRTRSLGKAVERASLNSKQSYASRTIL